MRNISILILFSLFINISAFSIDRKQQTVIPLFKPTVLELDTMDVNTIKAWYRSDGEFFYNHKDDIPGFVWPKGGAVSAIFSSAMWIGAKVKKTDDTTSKEVRVAVAGHMSSEYRPGIIFPDGTPDDYTTSNNRYFRVKPNEDTPTTNPDMLEWPWENGAPYHDKDGDGKYNPIVDKPALIWGNEVVYPDMMMYTVYNDADEAFHNHRYGWGRTRPLGVEVRQLNWAYNRSGPFGQMVFMRFEIINKAVANDDPDINRSLANWDSTYLVVWSDPDLGYAFDDYMGVDTTIFDRATGEKRNLGYCYNGDNNDEPAGYGVAPPAVGYKYFQGPRIYTGLETDTAKWSGRKLIGYKNLNVSGFNFYCNPGQGGCTNPDWYDPDNFTHTYNVMQGFTRSGRPWIDPNGDTTRFVFAGDPVKDIGWTNKNLLPPSDVRLTLPAGPFTMAPGDTQQVVVGVIVGRGSDNLNSITVLRSYSDLSQTLFNNNFKLPVAPPNPKLEYSFTDGNLLLTWDNEAESFSNYDARFDSTTWKFHGYSLYQTNDPLLRPNAKIEKIGTYYIKGGRDKVYDWVPVPNVDEPVWMKIWEGNSEGIINHLLLEKDYIAHKPFIAGRPYYFILTATAIAEYEDTDTTKAKTITGLKVLESPRNVITIVPKKPVAGTDFPSGANYGDFVPHNKWFSNKNFDDAVQIKVVDPWKVGTSGNKFTLRLPGYEIIDTTPTDTSVKINLKNIYTKPPKYKITFDGVGTEVYQWRLWQNVDYIRDSSVIEKIRDTSKYTLYSDDNTIRGDTLILSFNNFSGDENYPVVSNVMAKVIKQPVGVRRRSQSPTGWSYQGKRWFTGLRGVKMDDTVASIPALRIPATPIVAYPRIGVLQNITSGLKTDSLRRVEIRFSNTNTQKAYRYIQNFLLRPRRGIIHPEFRPFVVDTNGFGYLYQDYEMYPMGDPSLGRTVPFTVWEVDSVYGDGKPRQLTVAIVERNDTLYTKTIGSQGQDTTIYNFKGNVDARWSPSPYTVNNSLEGDEIILIFRSAYSDTVNPEYTVKPDMGPKFAGLPLMYAFGMRRINSTSNWSEGDVASIRPNYGLSAGKVFEFEVKAPQVGMKDLAKLRNELTRIKVVPNPYFASHQLQANPFDSFVTFTNLPAECKIRIFNLVGDMVAVIEHNSNDIIDNSATRWDLKNHAGISVASGMYIAHIEAPGIGDRIVKFAIFIQEERLDTF